MKNNLRVFESFEEYYSNNLANENKDLRITGGEFTVYDIFGSAAEFISDEPDLKNYDYFFHK